MSEQTVRQRMTERLEEGEMSARDLSRELGVPEKEVYAHLPHIARSAAQQHRKLVIRPYRCLACGFVFADRSRLTRPSRCPRCRESHIEAATYRIE